MSSGTITYSSVMRELRKNHDEELVRKFMKSFKDAFDKAFLEDIENPAEVALLEAIQTIDYVEAKDYSTINRLVKIANPVVQMGDPDKAGKALADIMKFLLSRISPANRINSLINLKKKILDLDPYDIASKHTPATASIGQSITFLKTILIGHNPMYIMRILEEVAKNLV